MKQVCQLSRLTGITNIVFTRQNFALGRHHTQRRQLLIDLVFFFSIRYDALLSDWGSRAEAELKLNHGELFEVLILYFARQKIQGNVVVH
jgi:hypothetical protein